MAELIDVVNSVLRRSGYDRISNIDKERFFFIINRYLSKDFPDQAQLLNDKRMDKSICLDLWFHFLKGKPYPKSFWSKSPKSDEKSILTNKQKELLMIELDIREDDLNLLAQFYPKLVKEELKYFTELYKLEK